MSKKSEQAALLAFLAGAAVAAGAALLFTPKTGREVREKLGEAKDEALDKLKGCVKNAKMRSRKNGTDQMNYDGGDCWI
ncbi:YtxH domain-containing protein [Geomonas anaerohicana]|uniref:YtxH domain-containing protein n=1 Tax=Geomonas anaerohicana TaxID=2798583 RepID=A0ABS0YFH1_9BACT|nr:YtxH domain-containing protein [Geomonas anaerohicana]MBJ6751073.1 YtxH domain-containing protein [Geomonas anaerohicana]